MVGRETPLLRLPKKPDHVAPKLLIPAADALVRTRLTAHVCGIAEVVAELEEVGDETASKAFLVHGECWSQHRAKARHVDEGVDEATLVQRVLTEGPMPSSPKCCVLDVDLQLSKHLHREPYLRFYSLVVTLTLDPTP